MIPIQHTIIGLPRSGKTTFLAALWHLITARAVNCKLELEKLDGDRTHLNMLADIWCRCEEVPRTSMAAEMTVLMHVKDRTTNKKTILQFPDLSGESFERQLSTRSCSPEYLAGFDGNGGVLLFVTANCESDAMSIVDFATLTQGEEAIEKPEEHQEWTHKMVSTQVNLVDLLQFLQQRPFQHTTRRVAVIVSAWDVMTPTTLEPVQWLQQELPLLYQFLISNPASFVFQVYGVSAQGGDVKNDPERIALASQTPSTRIKCIGPETDLHDLTSPIIWLMTSE